MEANNFDLDQIKVKYYLLNPKPTNNMLLHFENVHR